MRNDQLYINGVQVELNDTTNFSFDFSVADIKDPSKRSRNVSKTLTIPGTQNNLQIFYSAYQLSQYFDDINAGVGFEFDPRVTHQAQYYVNGQLRFSGYLQILKTKILNEVINFEVVLFSNIINLLKEIGDITISELGWDEYNHVLNHTNISNSWNTSVRVNGVATSNFTSGIPNGFGYYWTLADYGYGGVADEFEDNKLYAYIYYREILIKAFARIGYTITGAFIDSVMLKRAIFGMGGGDLPKLSSTDINNRLVDTTFMLGM